MTIALHTFLRNLLKITLSLRQLGIIASQPYAPNIGNAAKLRKDQRKVVNLVNTIVIIIVL